jgi:thiol-disulfide isomerase/thioredoxin
MKLRRVGLSVVLATAFLTGFGWHCPGLPSVAIPPAIAQSDDSDQDGAQAAPTPVYPELMGQPTDWLNTDGKALHLNGAAGLLDGKHAVLIDFWDYTCINCVRTIAHLSAFADKYGKFGLVIIGIHTPEFRFAHDSANVTAAVARLGIKYPVLIDSDAANWASWNTTMWPRHILIDPAGQVTEDHNGEGHYDYTEMKIRDAIREIHPSADLGPMVEVDTGDISADATVPDETPEMYCGFKRGSNRYTEDSALEPDVVTDYVDRTPDEHPDGSINLSGWWRLTGDSLQHTRDDASDYVVIHYHGPDANAVIKPESSTPFNVFVLQDGDQVAKTDAGSDILYDDLGHSYIRVDTPRMYSLTKNAHNGGHELMLQTASTDLTIYSFSF